MLPLIPLISIPSLPRLLQGNGNVTVDTAEVRGARSLRDLNSAVDAADVYRAVDLADLNRTVDALRGQRYLSGQFQCYLFARVGAENARHDAFFVLFGANRQLVARALDDNFAPAEGLGAVRGSFDIDVCRSVLEVSILTDPFIPETSTRAPGESSKVLRISSRTSPEEDL